MINNKGDVEQINFNNFKTWKIIKDISLLEEKEIGMSDLARKIKIDRTNPYFQAILTKLLSDRIIFVIELKGRRKIIKIDYKKLRLIVESSSVWTEFAEYVHSNKMIYANI